MKTLLTFLFLTLAAYLPAAEAPPPIPDTPIEGGRFYADTFASLSTPDFSHGETYGYGLGVGYQWTKVFATDIRLTHAGLNIEDNAVSTIGGRLVARLPWNYLTPYGFLGASFDLRPDEWRLQPGIGVEIGVTQRLRGLTLFGEAGTDADLKGHSGYTLAAGLRWRF